ncbi:MAG: CsgG/HfaB family protein [Candidatus Desulfofervidus auxilii]|nr:CsgG/HfaB family protein [Candidatus Desulfofervidus auxilii]
MRRIALVIGLIFILSCAAVGPTIKIAEYYQTPQDIQKAEIMPPKYVLQKKKPRIVVLEMGDYSGKGCRLGHVATELMHNVVAKTGTFEVVERSRANQLARELGYQEEHGVDWEKIEERYFSLGKDIDYAIVGAVNEVLVSQNQKPGYYTKEGIYIPPECSVRAEVTLNFRVIDFSTGRVVKSFSVKGSETDIARQNCRFSCGLAQKALSQAINRYVPVHLIEAIPIYGYIRKIMTHSSGAKKIAYITLGRADGIVPGDEVEIIEHLIEIDPVTNRQIDSYIQIGKGKVVQEGLTDNEAIILVTDKNVMSRLKIGQMVRLTAAQAKKKAQQEEVKDVLKDFWKSITR